MKVVVMKLDFHDDRSKKKVMKIASGHSGVVSIAMDSKDMKLTVTGDLDPVGLVSKLRKNCHVDIISVGPPPKKEEPKKPEAKKEEPKKDPPKEDIIKFIQAYESHHASIQYPPPYYCVRAEEDPNACVIC